MSDRSPCFETQRIVEFHETDMAGIVHFSNFFRYMESAEHRFLHSLNQQVHGIADGLETGWPRVNANCDYLRPARFGDRLKILVFIDEVRNRSLRYRFEFHNSNELIATGSIAAAYVAMTAKGIAAIPIPDPLRQKLLSFTPA